MENKNDIEEKLQKALDIVENATDITDEQLAELSADKELLQDCRDIHSMKMSSETCLLPTLKKAERPCCPHAVQAQSPWPAPPEPPAPHKPL